MNRKALIISLLLATIAVVILAPLTADAVPGFARQYKLSCTTCHAPFPRLKAFGEEFAGNGFVIPEEEKDRDFVIAGDDLLRLNRTFPIAARFDAYLTFQGDDAVTSDLEIPWGMKLLSGGSLAQNVGYYFYFYMSERGEVAGIEDAYIHFNDIGGKPFDVMVGQFQTSDPLMKRELRLTYEDYLIYKTKVGNSDINLTYDRGVMVTYDIEKTGTGLAGMVVNGNGKGEADADQNFDQDKYKNFGMRAMQEVTDQFSVGYFYYYGKEVISAAGQDNEVTFHGPDFVLGNGTLDLTCQYLFRSDTHPNFNRATVDVETEGMIAELVYSPQQDRSRHYFTLLYNRIDSDQDDLDLETLTGGVTYLMARNLRATLEYTAELDEGANRGVVGLVGAF